MFIHLECGTEVNAAVSSSGGGVLVCPECGMTRRDDKWALIDPSREQPRSSGLKRLPAIRGEPSLQAALHPVQKAHVAACAFSRTRWRPPHLPDRSVASPRPRRRL